jgi:antitoxin ParD1/3/4
VVREALRLLEERDRLARLRAAIAVGDAQIARGEGIPYTPELLVELDREVDERVRRGDRPNPDVWP